MTCVVAAVNRTAAVMAADRQIVDGWLAHPIAEPKIAKSGQWLLGTCGPVRVNNAVKRHVAPPHTPQRPTEEWALDVLIPSIRRSLDDAGLAVVDGWIGGKEDGQQGTIIVATPGSILTISADWAVEIWSTPFAAIGTGSRAALGALYVLEERGSFATVASLESAARTAMNAVAFSDVYTGSVHDVLSVLREGDHP